MSNKPKGSTVHQLGCQCGFCKMGDTRAEKPSVPAATTPICDHKGHSGHPADSDIRMCEKCNGRSVDGGATWMTFAQYRDKHCHKDFATPSLEAAQELKSLLRRIEDVYCSCDAKEGHACAIHQRIDKLRGLVREQRRQVCAEIANYVYTYVRVIDSGIARTLRANIMAKAEEALRKAQAEEE